MRSTTNAGTAEEPSTFEDRFDWATAIVKPARLHVGIAHDMDRFRLAADLNYQAPRKGSSLEREFPPVASRSLEF